VGFRIGSTEAAFLPSPNTPPFSNPDRNAAWKPLAGLLWFASLIAWEILFGLCVSALAMHVNSNLNVLEQRNGPEVDESQEYKNTHRLLGAILSFVIGFRVNNAYQLYYEGRRIVGSVINSAREIVLEAYTSLPKGKQ
jgi:predicted membrane chloride channel (bestrophin family)